MSVRFKVTAWVVSQVQSHPFGKNGEPRILHDRLCKLVSPTAATGRVARDCNLNKYPTRRYVLPLFLFCFTSKAASNILHQKKKMSNTCAPIYTR